ncbi:NAD-dependent deacylase [candidate division KSB1 bacterium]|nr:NAD-dependent deacylase [candidate division KSB1 bacterium]
MENRFSPELLEHLANARRVMALTGAGISAESGVPTFRSPDGIWSKFKPEELASMDAFMRNPKLVWEWYQYRRRLIYEVEPNPGHRTLVDMEAFYLRFRLFTQNVDGLHHKAGSKQVYELHGNIMRNRCSLCGRRVLQTAEDDSEEPAHCRCGGLMRPDVVWFGEILPEDILSMAYDEAMCADLFFSIGTSAVVYPAAHLPVLAVESGAYVVEINPESTMISSKVHTTLRGKSGDILPALWSQLSQKSHF